MSLYEAPINRIFKSSNPSTHIHNKVYGDGSPSTFWDSRLTISEIRQRFSCKIMSAIKEGTYHGAINSEGDKINGSFFWGKNLILNKKGYLSKVPGKQCIYECQKNRNCSRDVENMDATLANVIHRITPNAKLILILREPVSR